jgi:hypothetical protein
MLFPQFTPVMPRRQAKSLPRFVLQSISQEIDSIVSRRRVPRQRWEQRDTLRTRQAGEAQSLLPHPHPFAPPLPLHRKEVHFGFFAK